MTTSTIRVRPSSFLELIFDAQTSAKFLNSLPLNVLEKGLEEFRESMFERDRLAFEERLSQIIKSEFSKGQNKTLKSLELFDLAMRFN